MNTIDRPFVDDCIRRLEALPADRKPNWGRLTAPELVPHLIGAVRHSMGQLPPLKFMGNWITKTVLPTIVFTLQMSPPKNLKVKSPEGEVVPALSSPGDLNTLREVLEEYIGGMESGTLANLATHPLFGDLNAQDWGRVHVLHFRHHLKQFGI